jgi:hypothetical protein
LFICIIQDLIVTLQAEKTTLMATAVSFNISMPKTDMAFFRKLAKNMGWSIAEDYSADALYDPESGSYLNEETMDAIRDVESGKVSRCKDMNELLTKL